MNLAKVHTVFIVPYRDRAEHKAALLNRLHDILATDGWLTEEWITLFAHQCDERAFNRGAMKNLGFLAVKRMFPQTYKDLTLLFHDVDTFPTVAGLVPYKTVTNVVSHFYGYPFSLGGMFAIKGGDFEKTLGFPNFWGWGLEDNLINDRCLAAGLTIDRSIFYSIKSPLIERPFDGYERILSLRDGEVYSHERPDTFLDLQKIEMQIDKDNDKPNSLYLNVQGFMCAMAEKDQIFKPYDIRNGMLIRTPPGFKRRVWSMQKMFS